MARFISAQRIRELCGLRQAVPNETILPFLDTVQHSLKRMWGVTLYNRMDAAIVADETLATETELKTLLEDYTHPYLAWMTYYRALPAMHSAPDGNGVYTVGSDKYQPVDSRVLDGHRKTALGVAEQYEADMLAFLGDNSGTADDYPEYATHITEDRRPEGQLTAGYIFRKRRTKRNWFNPDIEEQDDPRIEG